MKHWLLSLGMPLVAVSLGFAGPPTAPPVPPVPPPPLLFLRLLGPSGVSATVFPGHERPTDLRLPSVIGVRPGYRYRLRLTGLPGLPPGSALYPSIEVHGMLHLPSDLSPAKYPVPVPFTAEDFRRALSGGMVTKVIYLENPQYAVPSATTPTEPIVVDVANEEFAWAEARRLGRPMLMVRLGERQFNDAEVAAQTVPGTILVPGEPVLPPAAVPPAMAWGRIPLYDPLLGPTCTTEECLPDGGDVGPPAGIGPDGQLHGLNPSDAVMEFTFRGRKRVKPSNRVCICVPRFSILRVETVPIGYQNQAGLAEVVGTKSGSNLLAEQPVQGALIGQPAFQMKGSSGLSAATNVVGLVGYDVAAGLSATANVSGLKVAGTVVEHAEIVAYPNCKLMLTKWIEPRSAQVGDKVTVYLRYFNKALEPITDVAISDSLIGRLEYVPNTAKSDRPATFTLKPNEAGSSILRWEIADRLLPGETGLLTFKARVR